MSDHSGFKIIDVYYIKLATNPNSYSTDEYHEHHCPKAFLSLDAAECFVRQNEFAESPEIKSYKAIKLVNYSRADNRVTEEFYELGEKIDYLTELSRKNDLRKRALQKLTKEEIEALGI